MEATDVGRWRERKKRWGKRSVILMVPYLDLLFLRV